MSKKITRVGLFILFWIILPYICVETCLTVFDPYFFKGFFEYEPTVGFRVRANYPTPSGSLTNANGFNDHDYPLEKSPGVFRILVVGDSFSWAGGLEGNYTALLEQKLKRYGSKVEVINAGCPATHTGEQLTILKGSGLHYNPDLVIVGFFLGNDFIDADPFRKTIVVNAALVQIDKRNERRIGTYPILKSRLLSLVSYHGEILADSVVARIEARNSGEQPGTFSDWSFLRIEKMRLDFFNASLREARYKQNIEHIFQSLTEMHTLLKSRNIRLLVAIFPDEFQVDQNLFERIVAKYQLNRSDYDLDSGQNLLKSFLDARGLQYVDLTDRFRTEGQKRTLYTPRDTHWNSAGSQLASDILFEEVVKMSAFPMTTMALSN